MTAPIRVLDTGLAPARWNVAMTAALVRRHGDGLAPDSIRFHRYRTCVLIGNGQRVADAVDIGHCRRRGIEIARRVTGGGAVFISPRMLAWDVVLDRRSQAGTLDGLTRRICEAVAAGLAQLGAPARFDPPNAIVIDGAKISGSSGIIEGGSAVLQGTVMIEDDVADMAGALRMPEAVLRGRVSCLAAALATVPPLAQVQAAIAGELAARLGRSLLHAEPDDAELACAEKLLGDEIGTDDYVFGSHPPASLEAAPEVVT